MLLYKNILYPVPLLIHARNQYINLIILNTLIFKKLPDYNQDLCQANHEHV